MASSLEKNKVSEGVRRHLTVNFQRPKLSGILKNLQNPVELHLDVFLPSGHD